MVKDITSAKKEELLEEALSRLNELYQHLTSVSWFRTVVDYLSYLTIVIIVPLTVVLFYQPASSIETIHDFKVQENFDLIFPIIFIFFSLINIVYVREFTKDRILFEELQGYLTQEGIETNLNINIENTQASKMINRLQTAYILGTFFVVFFWYVLPDHGRLEPLSILYGFGTGLFGYFRTKLSVSSSIDMFVTNE